MIYKLTFKEVEYMLSRGIQVQLLIISGQVIVQYNNNDNMYVVTESHIIIKTNILQWKKTVSGWFVPGRYMAA